MRKVIVLGSVSLLVGAIACGGAAPPSASSPARESAPEPATVEEAQQQIAEAKAALEGRGGEAKESADAKASTSSTEKTPAAPATQPKTVDKDHDGIPDSVDSKCVSPCRALASMRRAVTALCRMAGADDTRCTDAKKTLEASESKVATCGC